MLKKEWKYNLKSPLLYLTIIPVVASWLMGGKRLLDDLRDERQLLSMSDTTDFAREILTKIVSNVNGYAFFKEGMHEFFMPFAIVLITGLLFSGKFNYDKTSGFGNCCITRTRFKSYFWSRTAYTFLSSFLYTFFSMMLILAGSLLVYSAKIPKAFSGTESIFPLIELFSTKPLAYCLIISLNLSLFAGVFSLYGMGASAWIKNRFVCSLVPAAVFAIGILLPQFVRIDALRWVYPENISAFFGSGGLISDEFTVPVRLLIVWLVFLAPVFITLPILYKKNKQNYLR